MESKSSGRERPRPFPVPHAFHPPDESQLWWGGPSSVDNQAGPSLEIAFAGHRAVEKPFLKDHWQESFRGIGRAKENTPFQVEGYADDAPSGKSFFADPSSSPSRAFREREIQTRSYREKGKSSRPSWPNSEEKKRMTGLSRRRFLNACCWKLADALFLPASFPLPLL